MSLISITELKVWWIKPEPIAVSCSGQRFEGPLFEGDVFSLQSRLHYHINAILPTSVSSRG